MILYSTALRFVVLQLGDFSPPLAACIARNMRCLPLKLIGLTLIIQFGNNNPDIAILHL